MNTGGCAAPLATVARLVDVIPVRLSHAPAWNRHTPGPPEVPLTTLPLPPSTVVRMSTDGKPGGGGGLPVNCDTLVRASVPRKVIVNRPPKGPPPPMGGV